MNINVHNSLQSIRWKLLVAAAAVLVAGSAGRASANIVTVGQLGTINMTAGTQSDVVTVPIFDAGGPTVQLQAWALALRIVPTLGASGTVTIDQPSIAYPANSILPPGDRVPSSAPGKLNNNPTPGDLGIFATVGIDDLNSYTVNSSGQAMFNLRFNASALASGNFDILLVNSSENVYWTDGTSNNQNFYVDGVEIPRFSTASASLGTISVAAVPEPSSLLLSGTVVGLAAWRARRKKRKQAETAATVPSA